MSRHVFPIELWKIQNLKDHQTKKVVKELPKVVKLISYYHLQVDVGHFYTELNIIQASTNVTTRFSRLNYSKFKILKNPQTKKVVLPDYVMGKNKKPVSIISHAVKHLRLNGHQQQ